MTRYKIPKRVFMQGDKKPVTLRMPSELKQSLEKLSKDLGRNLTDLILTVLDQYAQQELNKKNLG